MIDIFFDDLDKLYHQAKFGEDHAMRAGCGCENVVLVCFLFVTLKWAILWTGALKMTDMKLQDMKLQDT